MASSIIDALLPGSSRAPGGDSPGRGGDGAPFGPVLSQALRADDAPAPLRTPTDKAPQSAATDLEAGRDRRDDEDRDDLDAGAEPSQRRLTAEEAAADQGDEDEVEISEEASTVDATAAAEAAAAANGSGPVAVSDEATMAQSDAKAIERIATEVASTGDSPATPAPTENAADAHGTDTPADTQEIGDVTSAAPEVVSTKDKRAGAANAKPGPKSEKSKPADGKSAKAAGHDGTTGVHSEADAAGADETAVASLQGKSAKATTKNLTNADGESYGSPADAAGRNDKRPTTAPSPAATGASAEVVPVEGTSSAKGGASPAAPPVDNSPVAPVAAAPAAPTTAPRGSAALARLTAERSVHATTSASSDDGAGGADRARFVGRVEGAIRAAHQRDGKVNVRLSPPELGALRIELTLHQGALTARVEAETTTARNLLLDNLPALRDRLAQHDVHVERFDVDVRQDGGGSGGSPQQGADDRAAREADGRRLAARRDAPAHNPTRSVRAARTGGAISDAGLDVRV
jgi:flagellar hook-length control protein FliK